MSEILVTETAGPLRILTLNEPARANPLSAALIAALTEAVAEAATEVDVRAIILTGAGRHFSAGADLAALERVAAGGDEAAARADTEALCRLYELLLGCPKLTVAAVHGAAVAGGCGLATACDLVVAEPRARFCYSEVKIGFLAAMVLTFLTRRVPGHVARRLLLDPRPVDGARAVELGLADELVADGQALARAQELALEICRAGSPSAIAATKKLLDDVVGLGWREALAVAVDANVRQRAEPDCRRGVREFLASKTTPDWLEG